MPKQRSTLGPGWQTVVTSLTLTPLLSLFGAKSACLCVSHCEIELVRTHATSALTLLTGWSSVSGAQTLTGAELSKKRFALCQRQNGDTKVRALTIGQPRRKGSLWLPVSTGLKRRQRESARAREVIWARDCERGRRPTLFAGVDLSTTGTVATHQPTKKANLVCFPALFF